MPAAANIINFSNPRRPNVIAHLFSFVSEDPIRPIFYCANHQVRKETVQLCAGVSWPCKATAAKRNGRQSKITSVFLHQKIGRSFRCPEERMFAVVCSWFRRFPVHTHALARFPTASTIRAAAADWASKTKCRLRRKLSRRFEQVQRAIRIDSKIGLRIAGRPIMRWLRSRMYYRIDLAAMAFE